MGKRVYSPLHWCTIRVPQKRPLPVDLCSDEHEATLCEDHPLRGEECGGFFDPGPWRVVIWAGTKRQYIPYELFHELGHAIMDGLGIVSDKAEEKVLDAIDLSLSTILKAQGWELPPLPDGWRGLAQHARRVRAVRLKEERAAKRRKARRPAA